ncbi:hypothetical protein F3087_35135 [Nocardia colli]|uniref:Uncharacterized protein n=1 Tax=Nocardia colli TaxID=2545717 RepID=A0A5N0E430_9NOCA|nr:hypothetical protein [Nocardia colli]KAA8884188.1 hypothetical protein F3087_35135 [Nocardia colli]
MPIRLALIELPKLLADIIADTFADDDSVRVDQLSDDSALELPVDGPPSHDVVIVGVTDPRRSRLLDRLSRPTEPTVLGVRTDGREAWTYRMRPCPCRLEQFGPDQIRAVVLGHQDPLV